MYSGLSRQDDYLFSVAAGDQNILDQFPPSIRSGTDHWPLVNIRCYCVVVLLICVVGARPRGELSLTNISIMSQCPVSSIQCPPPSLHRGHHV